MTNLPVPKFSRSNPYWQPLRVPGVAPEYLPRLTAQDYFYATTWELQRFFLQPKLCILVRRIRGPLWMYMWIINFRKFWRDEVARFRASQLFPFCKTGDVK